MSGGSVGFTLNGRNAVFEGDPDDLLLYVLRDDFALSGPRFGCGAGLCGSCFVLMDGHPVPSCDTPMWSVHGKNVETVEVLRTQDGALSPVQQACVDLQAFQCAYCASGILISILALLRRSGKPDEVEIRTALDRHLCRCGAQNRIIAAVLQAVGSRARPEPS